MALTERKKTVKGKAENEKPIYRVYLDQEEQINE